MKFIDWFAGIGGFRRGMELAGHECVGFCEFDKYAVMSYTAMHLCTGEQLSYLSTLPLRERQKEILKEEYRNGEWYANDVRSVDARSIPDSDCWCFGFPCQDISVAGKQLGFTGNRSSLFFRVMYLVGQLEEEKRPTYLFIENVKNLLSVNGGWDFARLLIEMDRGGYDAEWQVFNSKDFGVPQNRERCFIIGHLRGRGGSEVFPDERTDGAYHLHGHGEDGTEIKLIGHRNGYHRNLQVFAPDGITETLDTAAGGGRGHHTIEVVAHTRDTAVKDRTRVLSDVGISQCLRSTDYKDPVKVATPISFANGQISYENGRLSARTGVYDADSGVPAQTATQAKDPYRVAIPVITPDRAEKRQNGRRFKEDGDESFTLTAQDRHGVAISVQPMEMSGHRLSESKNEAHTPNCTDQQKVFGANQVHTMVGYNATSKQGGGIDRNGTDTDGKGLQRTGKSDDDHGSDVFAIDKGYRPEERSIANCIESREDRGLSRRRQEGTLICHRID